MRIRAKQIEPLRALPAQRAIIAGGGGGGVVMELPVLGWETCNEFYPVHSILLLKTNASKFVV